MRYIIQSITLILSFLTIFLAEQYASDYLTEIIGILIITYFAILFLRTKYRKNNKSFGNQIDIFLVNTIVILLIFITGSIYSPIFFLSYFLCFGIIFIFEPITIVFFAIGFVIIFIPEALQNGSLESFIKIGSVCFTALLGFFFGIEFKNREKMLKKLVKTKQEAKDIRQELSQVIENQQDLPKQDKEKLSDALQKVKKLER